ncbi:hypothetical protein Taro_021717 [Colocasia esculenta]|uniref:Uncharacterized protein n=1 Tax=Colocasia esculenta TaxID=4460 RepID=A0A843V920_COLES|nr:hypothetical protein [Colocasia esculenta]
MIVWVARATIERGEYKLDEEADDPKDLPRPNTFLARAVAEAAIVEEERDHGELLRQPYSSQFEGNLEAEVDLLGDIKLERVKHTTGGTVGESKKGKKGVALVEDPLDIADVKTLDPNAEDDTPSPLNSPRLPNSASYDSITTGGSSSDGRGGDGDTPQRGGGGDSGQRGRGGGITFTEEQYFRDAI